MNSVPLHAHHLGFNKCGAFAPMSTLGGFVCCVVNLTSVCTVNDYARNAVPNRTFSEIFHAILHFGRRGVCPKIAFNQQHKTEFLHRREVNAFIGDAG